MRLVTLLTLLAATAYAQDALHVSKAVYEQKVEAAQEEFAARRAELDELSKSDPARHELLLAQITRDRQLKIARAARAYLDDLEPTQRSLTKIGELDAAARVAEEIRTLKTSVDLAVLTKPPVAPARPSVIAPSPTPPVTSVTVNPPGLRPLRDDLWVSATRNGVPVRDVRFIFIPSGSRKTVEAQTDQLGKIVLRAEKDARYQIALVADNFEFQHVEDATAGNTYQFQIANARPGSGVVYLKDKERQVFLPGAGQVTLGRWRSSEGKAGLAFSAQSPRFRPLQNSKNLLPSIQARYGEPFRIVQDENEYEATLIHTGPGETCWLQYTKVK